MSLRFVSPDPNSIDDLAVELIVCGLWADQRPVRGLAGLLDFRCSGRLSRCLRSDWLQGTRAETFLMPGRPWVDAHAIVTVGLGPRSSFDAAAFEQAVAAVSAVYEGLRPKSWVLEVPGRADGVWSAERCAPLLFGKDNPWLTSSLWLVEGEGHREAFRREALTRFRRPLVAGTERGLSESSQRPPSI